MNKKSITLLSAAALIATVAAGNQVHAEDVTNPTTPITNEANATETKITESDVAKAKDEVTQAQTEVKNAQQTAEEATGALNAADENVNQIQEAIQNGEQAESIVEKQDQTIATKTEEKTNVDAQLQEAKSAQSQAQKDADTENSVKEQAQTDVEKAKAQLDEKQKAFDVASKENSTEKRVQAQKDLQNAKETVSQTTTQLDNVNQQIKEKETALQAPQKMEKKILRQTRGYKMGADLDADIKKMEYVDFQGERMVEIEVTSEQYEQYRKTGKSDFTPDALAVANAFVKLLNELRELNGFAGDMVLDPEFQAFAQARADEMLENDVLSHDSKLEDPVNSTENIGLNYFESGFISSEEIAYKELLGWYSDYYNMTGRNYGHRKPLLTVTGKKMGLGMAHKLDDEYKANKAYFSFNTLLNTANMHRELDEEWGVVQVYDTPEDEAIGSASDEIANSWDESDKLHPKVLGRHMVFLPDFKFVYYANVQVEENRDALRQELATLNQQKVALVANKANAEQETQRLTQLVDALTQAETNAKQAKATAEKELSQAKDALAQASKILDVATANTKQKADILASATQKVNALTRQANQLANEIINAQALKDAALRHKQDLTALKATLEEAKAKQVQAKVAKDEADQKLATAQDKLVQVTNAYTQLKNRYDLQNRIDEALQPKDTENQSDDGTQIDNNQKDDTDNQNNAHVPNDEVKVDDNTSNNGTNNVGLIQTEVKTNKNIETLSNKELGVTDNALQETTGLSRVAARKAKENLPKAGFKENSVALFGFALFAITGGLSVKRSFRNE